MSHQPEPDGRSAPALAAFDEQMRRASVPNQPGTCAEWDGRVRRHVDRATGADCTVIWSELDEASADAAISAQVRHFAELGLPFEWKYHAHDRPADLPARLRAAGFEEDEPEAVMIADLEAVGDGLESVAPPDGIRVVPVTDDDGLRRLVSLHDEVFGERGDAFGRALQAQFAAAPDSMVPVLALAGDRSVCGARIEFYRGTSFASLWGGGTLPAWRGRGVYRALVGYRARLARERGVLYLHVDASSESRSILERLGFVRISTAVAFRKSPA